MMMTAHDDEQAWAAFERRDRAWDGRVIGAVSTTGIYCKPSCPARRPKREHVTFFAQAKEARAAGFRACLRCLPDEVGRDRTAVARALELIAAAEGPLVLAELAGAVGYAPHHFQRLFTREVGVSPAAYARSLRARRVAESLEEGKSVTEAIYDSGYSAPSRFYAEAGERLGMTPSAWRDGGKGATIRFAVRQSAVGPLLIAATERGICWISFDTDPQRVRERFARATVVADDGTMAPWADAVVALVERPAAHDLPLDVGGTAFQERVWRALRDIPAGETRSYAEIAAAVGAPGATRAVGSANGANPVTVLVPCHRVIRSDGSLGGYAGGLDAKRALLKAEGARWSEQEALKF